MDTTVAIDELKRIVPSLVRLSSHVEASYDAEADVLYVSFEPGTAADDSELTDDDILLRFRESRLVGVTVMNASKRAAAA